MKLSVIIVSYNVKYFLEQCLRSVTRAMTGIECEVIVVDNASTDGTIAYVKDKFPNVLFIENSKNVGFARANNQAIQISKGEYVLLLNPDTIITEHTFTEFINFMDNHPDAGACGAYMLHTNGSFALESRRGQPTPFVAFCKISGLSNLLPKSRIFGRYYMRYLNENEINQIEIISGAYMFLRREALEKVGLLDEDFFMYGEDIDLSYRILTGKFNNYFLPSRILHYKGESTNKSSYRYIYTFYQAMQIFFNKHYSHYSIFLSLPISIAIWTQAFITYIGNQFRYRKKEEEHTPVMNVAVIGSKQMLEEMRKILHIHQPHGRHTFIEGDVNTLADNIMPEGFRAKNYTTIAYDVEMYSYCDILKHLEANSRKKMHIATYSTKTKRLITSGTVYTND